MMSEAIKLFGGPVHGSSIAFRGDDIRLPYIDERLTCLDEYCESVVYRKHRYLEQAVKPCRYRVVAFGLLEGDELSPQQRHELESSIKKTPWKFPEVNILTDFEEWFAQACYRHFGELRWKGERVYC